MQSGKSILRSGLSSLDSGFEDEIRVFGVFFIKLFHPLGEDIGRQHQILSSIGIIDDQISVVVAHHVVK
jgi:hypothetical protein